VAYFCNFQNIAHSKQSPIGQKFAQSGYPGMDPSDFQGFREKKPGRLPVLIRSKKDVVPVAHFQRIFVPTKKR
jgi:hypothetical protein